MSGKIERAVEALQETFEAELAAAFERGKAEGAAEVMSKITALAGVPAKTRKPRGPNKPKPLQK